jgi:hypothetical protein
MICGIIIVVLLILIMCIVRAKLVTIHTIEMVMPMDSFTDIKGGKIKGAGLTRSTTPARKSCPQLMVPQSQETSLLRPNDF